MSKSQMVGQTIVWVRWRRGRISTERTISFTCVVVLKKLIIPLLPVLLAGLTQVLFLMTLEGNFRLPANYMFQKADINERMRSIDVPVPANKGWPHQWWFELMLFDYNPARTIEMCLLVFISLTCLYFEIKLYAHFTRKPKLNGIPQF